jgi:hypothetical protein
MHRYSTKAFLFDLPTTTANPCPRENPCNQALHAAGDSNTSPVMGNPRKAGDKAAMARSNVLRWWVGTENRMLRSKAAGVSILGNVKEVIAIQRRRRGTPTYTQKAGLILGGPPKRSHTGRHRVGWYAVVCYGAPEWFRRKGSFTS